MTGQGDGLIPVGEDARAQQLALMVDSVTDYAVFLLTPDGHVASWNRGAERIKGYTGREIVGRHFSAFYTPADRAREHPAHELEIAAREGRYEEEGRRVRKDGSEFWANVVITAVRDDHGVLIGFAKITRDLTERRAAEETLQEAHARLRRSNEELDRFAVVAAHDLSEPLNTVAGFAALLRGALSPDLADHATEYLDHIAASTGRMQALIAGLLDYARSGEAARSARVVDARAAARHVVDDLAAAIRERGAEVAVRLDPATSVLADPSDLEMVLRNLVANAIKFGDPETPHVEVTAEPADDAWRIVVSDDGTGIDSVDQARIFEAFERADVEPATAGTGLGLAICERIVRRSGGEIGVDSAAGRGSRFWFTLPRAAGDPERPGTAGRTAQAPS